jgi:hypothetical protein
MLGTNNKLKALIIERYGTQKDFLVALEDAGFSMCEARLSRILHRRARPNAEERRVFAWRLQKPAKDLFGENGEVVGG